MIAKVANVAAAVFGMYNCTDGSDVGTGSFSLVLGTLHVCGNACVQSHVSSGMGCTVIR